MSFSGWKVKQSIIQSHHGILFSNKKERTIAILSNLDESPENFAEGKKSIPEVTCYIIPHVWHSGNDKIIDGEQISGC